MIENEIIMYIIIFIYGITIGSFLNVCIYRIPKGEGVVRRRSHCMKCGYMLRWYDLIPVLSFVLLKGRCRKCKEAISLQYPIIEVVNGVLYVLVFYVNGFHYVSILYCLMVSALLALSVIDFHTKEIPFGFNVFIFILGMVNLILDRQNWTNYLLGFLSVSAVLFALFYLSKGRAIGGGDVKLMAACGFLIGWKLIILAFVLGCIIGSIIHMIRMRFFGAERELAMGPYLSIGILFAILWGNQFLNWYLTLIQL